MPFEATIGAFAHALSEPSAPPPAMTHGRLGAPDARRFSVYRNNVVVGLIGVLEARYPAFRRIAGDDVFRALARAFVRDRKPRSPVMIAYGEDFPEFLAACAEPAPSWSLASQTWRGSKTRGLRPTTPRTRPRRPSAAWRH
jgi:hypothetical protein